MDQLKICMDTLNALARQSSDPNWYYLAEHSVVRYLQTPGSSLQQLSNAIDREAESSQYYIKFWTTMQEFVATRLPPDA